MPYGLPQGAMYNMRGNSADGMGVRNRGMEQFSTSSGNPNMPIFNTAQQPGGGGVTPPGGVGNPNAGARYQPQQQQQAPMPAYNGAGAVDNSALALLMRMHAAQGTQGNPNAVKPGIRPQLAPVARPGMPTQMTGNAPMPTLAPVQAPGAPVARSGWMPQRAGSFGVMPQFGR